MNLFTLFFSSRNTSAKKTLKVSKTGQISNPIKSKSLFRVWFLIDFRQCFKLYATEGVVTTPQKLGFIMRSLNMKPTAKELSTYYNNFKKEGFVNFEFSFPVLFHFIWPIVRIWRRPNRFCRLFEHYPCSSSKWSSKRRSDQSVQSLRSKQNRFHIDQRVESDFDHYWREIVKSWW